MATEGRTAAAPVSATRRRIGAGVVPVRAAVGAAAAIALPDLLDGLDVASTGAADLRGAVRAAEPADPGTTTALLDLIPSLLRTLFVTAASIAGILALASPASYTFARMRFLGRGVLFQAVLAMLMVPGVILLVPRFIEADQLGLRGSLWGLIVFYVAGGQPFAIFLLTTFFKSQSEEIFEAAGVDGASELRALLAIAISLAMPILVTITVMDFLRIYDDFVWPSLMLPKTAHTLILALERYNPPIEEFISRPDLGAQTAGSSSRRSHS